MPPLDAAAIERTLGFTPGFSLEDGLADYVHTAGFAR
jgi:nucleoside-diphosphate-sugar epimerase